MDYNNENGDNHKDNGIDGFEILDSKDSKKKNSMTSIWQIYQNNIYSILKSDQSFYFYLGIKLLFIVIIISNVFLVS